MSKLDLTGMRIGIIEAKERLSCGKWLCVCDCGNTRLVKTGHFNAGYVKSCGCHVVNHGHTKNAKQSREYMSWQNMRARCLKQSNKRYKDYGEKGITVCDEWKNDFERFLIDMGRCPDGYQIDRIDNTRGYYPENCRWVSPKQNMRNRETTIVWTVFGKEYLSAQDAAKKYSVSHNTIIHWCGKRRNKYKGGFYPAKENCSWRYLHEGS